MRVLLVEDDEILGDGLKRGLSQDGYTVDWLKDGLRAIQALDVENFELMVLDLGLPKKSGLEVLKYARTKKLPIAVLILTASDQTEDRIRGLDAGADDYMSKPFDLGELCARLRALQRRTAGRSDPVLLHGNVELNPASHTVSLDGSNINVSPREFALLHKLMESAGRVLSREQLSQTLYGWEEEIDSNAVEVHIHNLRKKLGTDLIRTIRGIGYIIDKTH